MLKIVREHPALFLGESRDDLERITCIDSKTHERHLFKIVGEDNSTTIETLVPYPNELEFEIVED